MNQNYTQGMNEARWDYLPQEMRSAECDSVETRALVDEALGVEVLSGTGTSYYVVADREAWVLLCWNRDLGYVQQLRSLPLLAEAIDEAYAIRSRREEMAS